MKPTSILILAAGKGTRMKSELPKVLHTVGGTPMVERVLSTVSRLNPSTICLVVGHGGPQVRSQVLKKFPRVSFATQKVLNGSGGAVRQALAWLKKQKGVVVVTCGDAPLISQQSYRELIQCHRREGNAVTVLTTIMDNPHGYGRIVRGAGNDVQQIVEHLDATLEERAIREINTGTYCFEARALARMLPKLENNNAKKEYYLTDTLALLRGEGGRVGGLICPNSEETLGINSRSDLAKAEAVLFRRKADELMAAGVTILDPASTYISEQVKVGRETVIFPQTFISGETRIGSRCQIGPWSFIKDTTIENDVFFQASFSESAVIRRGAKVGPYSRVRPNSDIGPNAHIGNFSEVKNTRIGAGSKANHLSYLGDATLGKNVNIGAGTITCNYDGVKKSPTHIQDQAFIGSNVNLIAPVRVGAHAVVGAGSSINKDVPAWALAVERAATVIKKDWSKSRFKKGKKR